MMLTLERRLGRRPRVAQADVQRENRMRSRRVGIHACSTCQTVCNTLLLRKKVCKKEMGLQIKVKRRRLSFQTRHLARKSEGRAHLQSKEFIMNNVWSL